MSNRHVVCGVAELPAGQRKLVQTSRGSIGIFNVQGKLTALKNLCPHKGAPLCVGEVTGMPEIAPNQDFRWTADVNWSREGQIIQCPWHKWEYDLFTGRTITSPEFRVQTYDVNVEDGQIVLYV